jgi:hypothetical protein
MGKDEVKDLSNININEKREMLMKVLEKNNLFEKIMKFETKYHYFCEGMVAFIQFEYNFIYRISRRDIILQKEL